MKLFKNSAIALALVLANNTIAADFAVKNVKLYTSTDAGVLENATVVVKDGKVAAINPTSIDVNDVIDGQGKTMTAGFIAAANNIGLVEVGAVSRSRDAGAKKADITFKPALAYNNNSTVVPYTRKGGITSAVVRPSGGDDMVKGQAFWTDLSGDFDSVREDSQAFWVSFGASSKGSRATALQTFEKRLKDAKAAMEKAAEAEKSKDEDKKDAKKKEPSVKEQLMNELLTGSKPVMASVDRASDILALLTLQKQYGFKLVLFGAGDAVRIKQELADANVTVFLDPLRNLPGSFDSLRVGLTNAAELAAAGVKVAFYNGDSHMVYQLRFGAGNAVANGLPKVEAINAMTANVANALNIDAGVVAEGKQADLVLWSGDPLELSSKVEKLWIDGEEHGTTSRHDKLRDRYTTKSDMPFGYTK